MSQDAAPPAGGSDRRADREVGIARGTFLGVQADVATAVATAVISIVVSRALGPEQRGVFFLGFAAATIMAVVGNLGMSTAGIVFGANREVSLRQLHGLAVLFSLLLAAVSALIFLPFRSFWESNVLTGVDDAILILLCAGVGPLMYAQVGVATLTGMGRIPAVTAIRIGLQVVTVALTVPVAIVSQSADWTFGAWLAATVAYAAGCAGYMLAAVGSPAIPSLATVRRVVGFGIRGYVGTVSHHGFLRIDLFFLSARSGPAKVGLYSLSSVIAERISMLGTALYSASAARIGSSERDVAARLTAQLFRILVLGLVPAAVVVALLSVPGIPLVFGEDFEPAVAPFVLLLPGTVSLTLWYPVSLFIISSLRRPGTTTVIMASGLLLSLPLYYVMILWLDMSGAAIASSVVYMSVLAGGLVVFTRLTSIGPRDLVPRRADASQVLDRLRSPLRAIRR